MTKKRINYIDFLKFIGLTGIILAHVGSPDWVIMIRNFDVPLMVLLSSILAAKSIKKYNSNIIYWVSRIKRLVIPTWIFLIIYFIFKIFIVKETMNIEYYLLSFLLTKYGIGYIWIILIYLYSALLIPLFEKIKFSIKNNIIILLIYLLYEILYYFQIGTNNRIIDTTFYYIIPYGLLTYIGYNFDNISNKRKTIYAFGSFIIFISFAMYYYLTTNTFQSVQIAKYPPRIYYLSYGIFCSFTLILSCIKHNFNFFSNKFIVYISKHSMWIYLWHILVLDIYKYFNLPEKWYIKIFIVYIITIIIVLLINKMLDIIEKKYKFNFFKYLRG